MTTDKTPATLATAKHGGCVQLGQEQRSDLVPGIVRCAKCAFQLHRTNLYLQSGTVGAGDSKTEPCPNGCGPLWPVTWETWAREGWAEAERLHLEKSALSAQPSPGGQGESVTDAMVYAAEEAYANSKPDNLHESFRVAIAAALAARQPETAHAAYHTGKAIGRREAELEARQPVGELVVTAEMLAAADAYHDSEEYRSGQFGDDHTNAACYRAMAAAARQPVGEPVGEVFWDNETGEISVNWIKGDLPPGIGTLLYEASPAQAVDLGGIPEGWRLSKKATCYQLSRGNDIIGNLVGPDAEENAAIIARVLDSQAVGK